MYLTNSRGIVVFITSDILPKSQHKYHQYGTFFLLLKTIVCIEKATYNISSVPLKIGMHVLFVEIPSCLFRKYIMYTTNISHSPPGADTKFIKSGTILATLDRSLVLCAGHCSAVFSCLAFNYQRKHSLFTVSGFYLFFRRCH